MLWSKWLIDKEMSIASISRSKPGRAPCAGIDK
jgi:hypothetical protein